MKNEQDKRKFQCILNIINKSKFMFSEIAEGKEEEKRKSIYHIMAKKSHIL